MERILQQEDEERCWSLYLATVSNPFAEAMSFEQFRGKYGTKKTEEKPRKGKETGMREPEIRRQVQRAEGVLKGFVPPEGDV